MDEIWSKKEKKGDRKGGREEMGDAFAVLF